MEGIDARRGEAKATSTLTHTHSRPSRCPPPSARIHPSRPARERARTPVPVCHAPDTATLGNVARST
eukprot:scaffold735_cov376-Prasinococcus_capsulatus_cf.AAC.9